MSLIDCFSVLSREERVHIAEKVKRIQTANPKLSEKDAHIQAAREFQNETINDLHDVYSQLGLPGYEKPKEESKNVDQKGQTIAFAPYRSRSVNTLDEDADIRESPEYKAHQENVKNIAAGLGIKIIQSQDTWGGWVDTETGKPVQEVSNVIHIDGTPEQARLLAAALGKVAPEEQNAVMVGHYEPNGAGTEHTIKTGSFENGQKALGFLKDNGLEYFTLDKKTGDLYIVDGDNSNSEKIINFIKQLKDNGINAEHEYSHTNTEFIESGSYGQILEGERGEARSENRFDLNAYIEEARKKYEEISKSKEPSGGGGDRPPNSGKPKAEAVKEPQEPFVGIRMETLDDEAKNLFREKNVETQQSIANGLNKLAQMASQTGKNLFEAGRDFTTDLFRRIREGEKINLNTEDTAIMLYQRAVTMREMGQLENLTSTNEYDREVARMQYDNLNDDKFMIDAVLGHSNSEAGRAFRMLQFEGRFIPEDTLEFRRMDLKRDLGRDLSEDEEQQVADNFHEEQQVNEEIMKHQEEGKMKEFEQRVKDEVAKRLKSEKAGTKSGKVSKEKAKDIADKLRSFADKVEKFGAADLPDGTQQQGASIQKAAASAMRWVADNIENGRIPELIERAVRAFKSEDINEEELRNKIKEGLVQAGVDKEDVNKATVREDVIGKISKAAEAEKANGITIEMVKKGYVRDLVHSYIDDGVPPEEVLNKALADISKTLPNTDIHQLRDAYLKEGEYQLPTKEKAEKTRVDSVNELKSVTKLQTDLDLLAEEKELRNRGHKSNRPKGDFEKGLEKEKQDLLKQKSDILKDEKKEEVRKKKLADIDQKIKNISEKGELWEKNKAKADRQIDKEYTAKKKQLALELAKKGIKLERGSAFKKASSERVASSHNDRVKDLSDELSKAITDDTTPEDQKGIYEKVKDTVDKSMVNLNSVQDKDQLLGQGIDKIRGAAAFVKAQIAKNISNKPLVEKLANVRDHLTMIANAASKDKQKADLDVALDQYKKRIQSTIDRTERDIAAGNYADKTPVVPIKDGRAVELEIKRNRIKSAYNKMLDREEWRKKSTPEKITTYVKDTRRAALITNIIGLVKVGTSAVSKIGLEPLTRVTSGLLYEHTLGRSVSKAYGGEGFSALSELKALEASIGVLNQDKMLKMATDAQYRLGDAENTLREAIDHADNMKNQFGETSKEFADAKKKLSKAESEKKAALTSVVANTLYNFIGTNAWKDAVSTLVNNAARVEEMMGNIKSTKWADLKGTYEKYSYVIDTFGRIHSAMKNFSARNAFARGYILRMQRAIEAGEDVSSPEAVNTIASAAYTDFLQGKYMQKNLLTDEFKKLINQIRDGKGEENATWRKVLATGLEFDAPIVRVPLNLMYERIFEYKYGLILGSIFQAWEAGKGFKQGMKDTGSMLEAYKAAQAHLSQLPPEKADRIGRMFRKGAFGAGMYLLGAACYTSFGGFYNAKDRAKKKDGELGIDELMFGGHKVPKAVEKVLSHVPLFGAFLSGANSTRILKKSYGEKGNSSMKAVWDAAAADWEHEIDEMPLKNVFDPSQLFKYPMWIPGQGILKDYSELHEEFGTPNATGQLEEKSPQDFYDRLRIASGIGRNSIPSKEEGAEIKTIERDWDKEIKEAYQEGRDREYINQLQERKKEDVKNYREKIGK